MNDTTTFVCEECGAKLSKAWSDEESAQEYEDTFGRPPVHRVACLRCGEERCVCRWYATMDWWHSKQAAIRKGAGR